MRIARVLFARIPEPGLVKTRLARDLDDAAAYALYRWLLRLQNRRLRVRAPQGHSYTDYIYYAPRVHRLLARWRFAPDLAGFFFRFRAQREGDLGARLSSATAEVLRRHDLALIWGADIPALPPAVFEQAIALYPQSVVTLARDGGYAFISIARRYFTPEIFSGIRWSTHHAGADQLRALRRLGIPVVICGRVADFDRARNLPRVIRELDRAEQLSDLEDLAQTARRLHAGKYDLISHNGLPQSLTTG